LPTFPDKQNALNVEQAHLRGLVARRRDGLFYDCSKLYPPDVATTAMHDCLISPRKVPSLAPVLRARHTGAADARMHART